MKKIYCVVCGKHKKFKNPKISYILGKTLALLFAVIVAVKMKRYLKKKNHLRY